MQVNPTIEEILAQARLLSLEDRTILLERLRTDLLQQTNALLQRIDGQCPKDAPFDVREFRGIGHETWIDTSSMSVLDFEGIARGTWDEVGSIDEFLRQERDSWDG